MAKKTVFKKALLCAVMVPVMMVPAFLTSCSDGGDNSSATDDTTSTTISTSGFDISKVDVGAEIYHDTEHEVGYQLEMPEEGEEVAIIHTNYGDICLRFFPEAAPKAVENFLTHAGNGYYDGLIFHRVSKNFMIQGGDPEGTGSGGESIYGESFEDEFSDKLFNIRGSVAMANAGKDTNGSQFFINQANAEAFTGWESIDSNWKGVKEELASYYAKGQLEEVLESSANAASVFYNADLATDEVRKLYEENGGNYFLDGNNNAADKGHTVFAQVYDGMDVVDEIASVELTFQNETDENSEKTRPKKEVVIESIEVTKYSK